MTGSDPSFVEFGIRALLATNMLSGVQLRDHKLPKAMRHVPHTQEDLGGQSVLTSSDK